MSELHDPAAIAVVLDLRGRLGSAYTPWPAGAKMRGGGAHRRARTALARFAAVVSTAAINEVHKSAWFRWHGAYPQEPAKWRACATAAPAAFQELRASARTPVPWGKARYTELLVHFLLHREPNVPIMHGSRLLLRKFGIDLARYNVTQTDDAWMQLRLRVNQIDTVFNVGANGGYGRSTLDAGFLGEVVSLVARQVAYRGLQRLASCYARWSRPHAWHWVIPRALLKSTSPAT